MKNRIATLPWQHVLLLVCCAFSGIKGDSECVNGIELPDGTCDCYSCWSGDSCSEYASRRPEFPKDTETVTLTDDHLAGETIFTAQATDLDEEFCKDPEGCPCSTVTYFIVSQDGGSNFQIDKNTGKITVSGESYSLYPSYEIIIGASDQDVSYSTMTLIVNVQPSWGQKPINTFLLDQPNGYMGSQNILDMAEGEGQVPLSRHKRAITLPANVTFDLQKYGASLSETIIKVGLRIQFQLDILFPSGDTDIQVELFAPDSDIIVMMLCNVQVTVGNNLRVDGTTEPVLESLDNSKYNDRAIIALANVNNDGSDLSTEEPSTIRILYEAVMIENPLTADSTEYWVSAGAEYNNENDVWVGQASFTTSTADDSATFTDPPKVNFSGPSTLEIGSSAIYQLDLELNHPITDVKFDLFAPVNYTDIMTICSAKVTGTNEAYECAFDEYSQFTPVYMADGNTQGYGRVHIDLGRPLNKLAREYAQTPSASLAGIISMAVQVSMMDREDIISNAYWLGATIEIGTKTIWAGQLSVTAIAKGAEQPVVPVFNMSFVDGGTISMSKPLVVQVDMEVPEVSSASYKLEVMTPLQDGEAVFQVCSIRLVSAGENLACLSQTEFTPEYTISNDTTNIYPDLARVDLGTITNVGSYGWYSPNTSDTRNLVTFHILFKATDHPAATVGSTHDVYFGMFIGTSKLTIGRIGVTVGTSEPADNITAETTPEWAMRFGGNGNDEVPIGQTAQAILDIKTARNVLYSPFNIEFIMPNNSGEAMLKICKVELQSAGYNNPCVVKEGIERQLQMISSFDDGLVDRAVISLPSLCNFQQLDDDNEDHVVLAASFVVRDHPQFQIDPQTMVSAGVMYSPKNLWVGQMALTVNTLPISASVSTTPNIAAMPNNGNLTSIPLGYPARFLFRIKLAPNDTTPLALNLTTMDDALSLCDVRMVRVGDGYPCLDESSTTTLVFDEDSTVGVNRQAYIGFDLATNVGIEPFTEDSSFDSNTIEVEVVAKLTPDPALAPDASLHTFEAVLGYGDNYASTTTATATVTVTHDTTLINATMMVGADTMNVTLSSITGEDTPMDGESLTDIVKSESKRVMVNVYTQFNSTSQLGVTVTTPTNINDVMEILYIGLFDAGENLACLKHAQTTATYEPRVLNGPNTDIATLDIGYVCNVGAVINDTTADRIRVEAIVRLLNTDLVSIGDTLQLSAALTSNDQEILVQTFAINVADESVYVDVHAENLTATSDGVSLNSTEDPIIMGISETKVFPIVFRVPPYTSSKVWLDIDAPVNTSAIMTVEDVQWVRSGRNIPNLVKYKDDFVETKLSDYNTSQVTKYELNLGVLSNAGMTHNIGENETDDDTFSLDITVQMADNAIALDQTDHIISFGLHVAKFIFILDVSVRVNRPSPGVLEFNISSAVDEVNSTSDRVEVDTILRLSDLSTAEGQNTVLNMYLPPYVAHYSTEVTSPHKEILSLNNTNNAISIGFGPLFFTDEIHLTTVLESNDTHMVPLGITGLDSVFSFQPVADTHDSVDIGGDLDYVNFTITTTPRGGSDCTPGPLGMEAGTIKDCQISSSPDSITAAVNGRYNVGTGWSPFVHTGQVREERYFQVYFGHKVLVSKIQLQQTGTNKVTTLTLAYSNDGFAWIESADNVLSPDVLLADQELDVPAPQISRYLRVKVTDVQDNTQAVQLNFEFVGCEITSDGPTDPCTAVVTETPPLADFKRRTFLSAASTLYVCDGIKGDKGILQKCYSTTDAQTWTALDSRVGSILGYDSEEPRLYAVSASGLTYMSSADGVEWFTAAPDDVTTAKALTTFKPAIIVPLDGDSRLNVGTPDPAYTDSSYGATSVGLKSSGATVFTWSQCCP